MEITRVVLAEDKVRVYFRVHEFTGRPIDEIDMPWFNARMEDLSRQLKEYAERFPELTYTLYHGGMGFEISVTGKPNSISQIHF